MLKSDKVLIAWLCFLFILLIGFGFYAYISIKDTEDRADDTIDEYIEKQKDIEREVIAFVQEYTGFESDIITSEIDESTYFYRIKSGKEIYSAVYDGVLDEVKYLVHRDVVVYERVPSITDD